MKSCSAQPLTEFHLVRAKTYIHTYMMAAEVRHQPISNWAVFLTRPPCQTCHIIRFVRAKQCFKICTNVNNASKFIASRWVLLESAVTFPCHFLRQPQGSGTGRIHKKMAGIHNFTLNKLSEQGQQFCIGFAYRKKKTW